jgi:hypothetical protein
VEIIGERERERDSCNQKESLAVPPYRIPPNTKATRMVPKNDESFYTEREKKKLKNKKQLVKSKIREREMTFLPGPGYSR